MIDLLVRLFITISMICLIRIAIKEERREK